MARATTWVSPMQSSTRWVRRAFRSMDQAARKKIYDRMQAILVQEIPYVALFNETKISLERPSWTGFATDENGYDKALSWFGYYSVQPPKE